MARYNPSQIEPFWQKYWEEHKTFAAPRLPQEGKGVVDGKKAYILDMFPYPSGNGLHVGHPEGYTATDIVSRYKRMNGFAVLHPMGWDAFGLPAEQHAKKTGIHPRETTEKNIANFRRQLKMLGLSFDWDREIATTDVDYFRWTQWIFLVIYDTWYDPQQKKGRPIAELPIPDDVSAEGPDAVRRYIDDHRLAYQIEAPVNWCPELGTVLANEEVIDGVSERGGYPVKRMPLRQWMLRITHYADRLEEDLETLDWSESVKALQRNWIGRSIGAEVDFYIGDPDSYDSWKAARAEKGYPRKPEEDVLRIFTTRPDTLYGATYMVIAPEHPAVARLTTPHQAEAVKAYCEKAAFKSDLDRTDLAKEKTGVFTGSYAINPVNGKPTPVWIADYVLISYGTGAIMSVPAHDTRDWEFAKAFDLPIIQVVAPEDGHPIDLDSEAMTEHGIAVNSGDYNGLPTPEFKEKISADLAAAGLGKRTVNYKLRDWLFSRQHFWGEPFPLLRELGDDGQPTGAILALDPSELPLDLPVGMTFDAHHHSPEPPLEKAPDQWLYLERNGKRYKRETNTMPQWAGSCWYYLRYLDPRNTEAMIDPEIEKSWMPVDLYIGGAEHAVLHLLYARFWHKILFDRGYVSTAEPFHKLVNQGMILGEKEADGRSYKMSKSRGNVVNPDDVVNQYGADSLRLYEMFMGPLEAVKPWSAEGVSGVNNFLGRVWRMIVSAGDDLALHESIADVEPTKEQNRVLHKTILAVTEDIEHLSFNTAIARMMEFVNVFSKEAVRPKAAMEKFVLLLSPFAPHIAEELWRLLGHGQSLAYEKWPVAEASLLVTETITVPVQINGKLRAKIEVPTSAASQEAEAAALADPRVQPWIEGKTIVKKIVIPGKMINFVVK